MHSVGPRRQVCPIKEVKNYKISRRFLSCGTSGVLNAVPLMDALIIYHSPCGIADAFIFRSSDRYLHAGKLH